MMGHEYRAWFVAVMVMQCMRLRVINIEAANVGEQWLLTVGMGLL